MNLIKAMTLLFIFLLSNQNALARDGYTPMPGDGEDCIVPLDSSLSWDEQFSIEYLENMPDANWYWPALAGVATLLSLAIGTVPGPLVCCLQSKFLSCLFTSTFGGIASAICTFFSVAGTCVLGDSSYKKSQEKQRHLNIAQLIKDAYEIQGNSNPQNSIQFYLADYQNRYPTNEESLSLLAEKIRIANEAGLFVPADAFAHYDDRLSSYKDCRDAPNIHALFSLHDSVGKLFGANPQSAVDQLVLMSKEDLEVKRTAFRSGLEKWNQIITNYLSQIENAQKKRQEVQKVGGECGAGFVLNQV